MIICTFLLLPFYVVLTVLIPVITQVVQTVCGWVSSVIQVVTQVMSQVCSWLPWPLNKICDWVVTVVTTLQTVWNWICNTFIQAVLTFVALVTALLIYITRIICIVIDFIIGIPALALCLLRLNPPKQLRVCIKVLTDEAGQSAVTATAIQQNVARMIAAFKECNVRVIVLGTEHIVKPEYLTSTDSSPWSIVSLWHLWFTQQACWCCSQVTIFVVDQIQGAGGLTYWGDNWCRVDHDCNSDDTIFAHEVGHLCNLPHSSDANNVMYATFSATAHHFTTLQCCVMKRSPFLTYM